MQPTAIHFVGFMIRNGDNKTWPVTRAKSGREPTFADAVEKKRKDAVEKKEQRAVY